MLVLCRGTCSEHGAERVQQDKPRAHCRPCPADGELSAFDQAWKNGGCELANERRSDDERKRDSGNDSHSFGTRVPRGN